MFNKKGMHEYDIALYMHMHIKVHIGCTFRGISTCIAKKY